MMEYELGIRLDAIEYRLQQQGEKIDALCKAANITEEKKPKVK